MSVTCAVCATANPEGSRFCNSCGSRLPDNVSLAEERKVITALFCDLVGFTSASESADPEDVDRMLTRYFATARRLIEAHGGVVEKFIGDAVVGVFGVPHAHEDDPERAVRAALRICEDAASLPALRGAPLRLRIGINTGEALVRLNVTPGAGERFLAGDAVNTASRIQSVAPEMGVAVGEATWEATKRGFEYEELPPATLKGKVQPVRVFHPTALRARLGIDLSRSSATPFVGRSAELRRLTGLFDAAISERSIRFATVAGEPGLGKSRLVAELLAYVDAQPILVTWRQGRCLPYGTGISFWALGEILKAHTGILDSDGAEAAAEKLDRTLAEIDERSWLRERLLPLLGIESGPTAGRDEQFAAWRRFLELIAEARPTVLVFEDLHWADESMLMFLENLASQPAAVPLFVIGTTRPELFEGRPAFPGAADAVRVDLRPLSVDAAGALATALLDGIEVASELLEPILDRAGGNPLFVEEFVRLLRDRDLLVTGDDRLVLREGAQLPVPESIQALLAARLDALPPESKSVLTDAAVVGTVFWAGAVAATGDLELSRVEAELELLAAHEFIRIAPRSSMAGETEYTFWHALVRDVAYGALPRSARAARHVAVASWIEERASDRVEDVADVLAHHYSTALDLARAVGDDAQSSELEGPALRFLVLAGERALDLDVSAAVGLLERALALSPPGHTDRPTVLRRYGAATNASGRTKDAIAAYEEALDGFRAAGDALATADVLMRLSSPLRDLSDARGWTYPRDAAELLAGLGPSWRQTDALITLGFALMAQDRIEEALVALGSAEAVAAAIADPREADALSFRSNLLGNRGMARALLGDVGGLEEMREALRLSVDAGDSNRAGHQSSNLAQYVATWRGPGAAVEILAEGIAFATSRGLQGHVAYHREIEVVCAYDLGEHDMVLDRSRALEQTFESFGWVAARVELRSYRVRVATLRGELVDEAMLAWIERTARESSEPDDALGLAALVPARLLRGERDRARDLIGPLRSSLASSTAWGWQPRHLNSLVRAALDLGDLGLAESIARNFHGKSTYAEHAAVSSRAAILEARGDFAAAIAAYGDAADRWARFGVVPERAFALLGQGRSLVASGRPSEAMEPLERARAIFERLKAAPALIEIAELSQDVAPIGSAAGDLRPRRRAK
jgi:class 3 adenylate cyclase/tetratricopeptide (TPR) repeat protein